MRAALTTLLILISELCCHAQSGANAIATLVKDIQPQELHAKLGEPALHVIDVNEEDNYKEAHVPGAKRAEYDAITIDVLPTNRQDTLIFYCWSAECPAAGLAARTALDLGFANVYWMKAGITGWQDAGLPTEP